MGDEKKRDKVDGLYPCQGGDRIADQRKVEDPEEFPNHSFSDKASIQEGGYCL